MRERDSREGDARRRNTSGVLRTIFSDPSVANTILPVADRLNKMLVDGGHVTREQGEELKETLQSTMREAYRGKQEMEWIL